MSNVSQIYGTLRNSEPYIILNSTETEVSGNLSVLQNLDVCGNITFNNTDLSTALSNLVTGGQDASFTNVDITNDLNVHKIIGTNYYVGSRPIISANAQATFTDLELKDSNTNVLNFLAFGDTGDVSMNGTLNVSTINHANGVNIEGVIIQNNNVTMNGNLTLNNTDISGKLNQIDASLVDLASNSGGGGELKLVNSTNLITTNLSPNLNNITGTDNIILGSGNGHSSMSNANNILIGKWNFWEIGNYQYNIGIGYRVFQKGNGNFNIGIGSNISENTTTNDYSDSIAIGHGANTLYGTSKSISIGTNAGKHVDQNKSAYIAIGFCAAMEGAGNNSIIIGNETRWGGGVPKTSCNNVIILNATGTGINSNDFKPDKSNAFYVKPIQSATNDNKLLYNSTTGEITYQPQGDISGTITLSESDSLGNIDVTLATNTLTIDAKNVSYSTKFHDENTTGDINDVSFTNFIKNAQTIIYFKNSSSGDITIKGYTNASAPASGIKKNFADDIVLNNGDIALLTATNIHNIVFLSASIFK